MTLAFRFGTGAVPSGPADPEATSAVRAYIVNAALTLRRSEARLTAAERRALLELVTA